MDNLKVERGIVDNAYSKLSISGKTADDYQFFDVSETKKHIEGEILDFNEDSFTTTKTYDDNSSVVREYKKENSIYDGYEYSFIETYTDSNGEVHTFSGTQEFDNNGNLIKSEISGKDKDGSDINIVSYGPTSSFNITLTDKDGLSKEAFYNEQGNMISYKGESADGSQINIRFDGDDSGNINEYYKRDENDYRSELYIREDDGTTKIILFDSDENIETSYFKQKSQYWNNFESVIVDNQKQKIQTELYEGETFDKKVVKEFDSEGSIISETTYSDNYKDGFIDVVTTTLYDKEGNVKNNDIKYYSNGEIGAWTCQGGVSNCQLYAGINALSYTDEGKEIIKNAIKDNGDGSYSVYFKGLDENYIVSQEDISLYHSGDLDTTMAILIAAFDKAMDNINNNKKDYSLKERGLSNGHARNSYESTAVNDLNQVSYMLAGVDSTICLTKPVVKKALNYIQENSGDVVATAVFLHFGNDGYTQIKDIEGNKHAVSRGMFGFHEISIKSVDDNTVTLVNPWRGDVDIVVEKKEFLKKVGFIEYFDLNEKNANSIGNKFLRAISKVPYWLARGFRKLFGGIIEL